jgi:hypothetical protein
MADVEIVARVERRRKWTAEEKAALLAEIDAEGGKVTVADCKHRRLGSQSSVGRAHDHCDGPEGSDPQSSQLGA